MQTIIISGHLAADCETFQSKGDQEMVRFTVAVNSPKTGTEDIKPTHPNFSEKEGMYLFRENSGPPSM